MRPEPYRFKIARVFCPSFLLGWAAMMVVLTWSPSAASQSIVIELRDTAVVQAENILLGDVAACSGPLSSRFSALKSIIIGRAPLPGHSRTIDAGYVNLRLKQHRMHGTDVTLQGAPSTLVTRGAQKISRKDIDRIIRQALAENAPWPDSDVRIRDIQIKEDLVLPQGRLLHAVEFQENPVPSGRIPVSVSFSVDGRLTRRIGSMVVADVFLPVVVAQRPLRRRQVIAEQDVSLAVMNVTDLGGRVLTRPEDAVGRRLSKSIVTGMALDPGDLEIPHLVKRGDIVTLLADSGPLRVTTLGEVRGSGHKGQRVRVVNLDTRKELYGFVVDAKTVQVPF